MIQKSACSSHSDNEGWKENLDDNEPMFSIFSHKFSKFVLTKDNCLHILDTDRMINTF